MYPYSKFGIPISNNMRYVLDTTILQISSKVKVKVTKKWYVTPAIKSCIHTPNLGFLPLLVYHICSGHDFSKNEVGGQGHSDPKIVQDTPPSQDAFTHQIWDSYLKRTGQCKRTGGCYNELVVAFFSTSGGVKGKKIYTCWLYYLFINLHLFYMWWHLAHRPPVTLQFMALPSNWWFNS